MKYTIKVIDSMKQFTAYEGDSFQKASSMIDTLCSTLIIGRGTGTIYVSYKGTGNVPLWEVENGSAKPVNLLLTVPYQRRDGGKDLYRKGRGEG